MKKDTHTISVRIPLRLIPLPSSKISAPSDSALAMSPSILALLSVDMTGPRSDSASKPDPAFKALARSTRCANQGFVSGSVTSVLRAIQGCPAAPNAAPAMAFRAWFLLQSGASPRGSWHQDLPGLCYPLPNLVRRYIFPAEVDPKKLMALIRGSLIMKSTDLLES